MIDAFCHVLPEKYLEKMSVFGGWSNAILLNDMEARAAEMKTHGDLKQVLTLSVPEFFDKLDDEAAIELVRLANDSMAEVVREYPEQFPAAIATVYMGDVEEAVREIDRCVKEYDFRGVQLPTTFRGKPLASEEFFPIYEKMAELDLPILVHPCPGPMSKPDFIFDWPLETSWMMIQLATSGVFEKWPDIKFVTHHCGAMIPFWHGRLYKGWFVNRFYEEKANGRELEKTPEEYFENLRKFYADTALYGDCTSGIQTGIDFFGVDHILFGTDYPLNGVRNPHGIGETANTIDSIQRLKVTDEERQLIFEGNAKRIFKL